MVNVQDNIIEFKKACESFNIYFNDTDGVEIKEMSVSFYIDDFSQPKHLLNTDVTFWQKSSDASISIDALDGKRLHSEVTAKYCTFNFDKQNCILSIKGYSRPYKHDFLIEIA